MAVGSIKPMIQDGLNAGRQGFNLLSETFAMGSDVATGARGFIKELTAEPTEEEKKADEENEKREFLLMQAKEMQRQKKELERLGYKSFAELKQSLEEFYGTNLTNN